MLQLLEAVWAAAAAPVPLIATSLPACSCPAVARVASSSDLHSRLASIYASPVSASIALSSSSITTSVSIAETSVSRTAVGAERSAGHGASGARPLLLTASTCSSGEYVEAKRRRLNYSTSQIKESGRNTNDYCSNKCHGCSGSTDTSRRNPASISTSSKCADNPSSTASTKRDSSSSSDPDYVGENTYCTTCGPNTRSCKTVRSNATLGGKETNDLTCQSSCGYLCSAAKDTNEQAASDVLLSHSSEPVGETPSSCNKIKSRRTSGACGENSGSELSRNSTGANARGLRCMSCCGRDSFGNGPCSIDRDKDITPNSAVSSCGDTTVTPRSLGKADTSANRAHFCEGGPGVSSNNLSSSYSNEPSCCNKFSDRNTSTVGSSHVYMRSDGSGFFRLSKQTEEATRAGSTLPEETNRRRSFKARVDQNVPVAAVPRDDSDKSHVQVKVTLPKVAVDDTVAGGAYGEENLENTEAAAAISPNAAIPEMIEKKTEGSKCKDLARQMPKAAVDLGNTVAVSVDLPACPASHALSAETSPPDISVETVATAAESVRAEAAEKQRFIGCPLLSNATRGTTTPVTNNVMAPTALAVTGSATELGLSVVPAVLTEQATGALPVPNNDTGGTEPSVAKPRSSIDAYIRNAKVAAAVTTSLGTHADSSTARQRGNESVAVDAATEQTDLSAVAIPADTPRDANVSAVSHEQQRSTSTCALQKRPVRSETTRSVRHAAETANTCRCALTTSLQRGRGALLPVAEDAPAGRRGTKASFAAASGATIAPAGAVFICARENSSCCCDAVHVHVDGGEMQKAIGRRAEQRKDALQLLQLSLPEATTQDNNSEDCDW